MKKFLRIVIRQTPHLWYDWELPEGAQLNQIVAQMQMAGYVLMPTFWVPIESIAHMCIVEVSNEAAPMDFTKARMQ